MLAPGPATNCEITRSSIETVKLSSQPDAKAGAMIGKVMSRKAPTGPAPRSIAASSSARSAPFRRDCTVTVTYPRQKAIWAKVMVEKPRLCGQANSAVIETKSSIWVMPVMISGMISGPLTMPVSSSLPGKCRNRTRAIAARVPRIVAPVEAATPISNDSSAASRICWLANSAPYHFVENPPQTETSGEALKE